MSNDAKATSARRPGRPKAGSEDKKARILSEALTLFSTQGYVATSLADIARASDISKAGSCITTPRRISCSRPSLMPASVRHALATTVQLMKKIPYEKI